MNDWHGLAHRLESPSGDSDDLKPASSPIRLSLDGLAAAEALRSNRRRFLVQGVTMKRNLTFLVVLLVALPTLTFSQMEPGSPAQARIQTEVRHELLMLPYFGVFDNIEYRVDGNTVTLLGSVTRPTLKSDAGNVVKHI